VRELVIPSAPNTSITLAQVVPAGAFTLPGTGPAAPAIPANCRPFAVAATSLISSGTLTSRLRSGYPADWKRESSWRLQRRLGGNHQRRRAGLGRCRRVTRRHRRTTDMQRECVVRDRHPEKVIDFAYRAVHEMAVKSKAIMRRLRSPPRFFSYWAGCSTGGGSPDGGSALPGRLRWD